MVKYTEEDIKKFYKLLRHRKDEFTEIRIIGLNKQGILDRTWLQKEEDFINFCGEWSGKAHVYAGINPRPKHGTGKNDHIKRATIIPIDIDVDKPPGTAASQEELDQAKEQLSEIIGWFNEKGFEAPSVDMSGNGYHILVAVDLIIASAEEHSGRINEFYNDLPVKVDPAPKDPARVIKVPGTWSLKGDHTPERPHRLAKIIQTGTGVPDVKFQEYFKKLSAGSDNQSDEKLLSKKITPQSNTDYRFSEALQDERIRDLYQGDWRKHQDQNSNWSRSEAEYCLILALFHQGLTPQEIPNLMKNCLIGKWQNEGKQYREITIKKAWNQYKSDPRRFFNRKQFIPSRVADEILEEKYIVSLRDTEEIYLYDSETGIYNPESKSYIKEAAKQKLNEHSNSHRIKEVITDVIVRSYITRAKLGASNNLLVLQNGVYNLDTDTRVPHSPEYMATSSLPIEYNPEASCPKITQFLGEVLKPEDFDLMIELIGYCLCRAYPIARIFVLTGEGRNGKSRLLLLISRFLGKHNVSSLTLQEISQDRFAKAHLYNKLANIAADIPATPIKYTGDIKALTGEDSVSAQHKFHSRFEFMNYAKLLFSANEVPATYDNTLAFFRRMMIIHFPNSFPANSPKTDPNIVEKITSPEELSGLLNIALTGLKRLIKNGHFTGEKSVEERQYDWIRKSNPIQYFALHYVEQAESVMNIVKKEDLYRSYVQLCNALNQRPRASNTFSNQVKRFLPYIDEGTRDIPDGSKGKKKTSKTRVWFGIRIMKTKLATFIESQNKDTIDTIDTMSDTLSTTSKEEQTPTPSKVPETVSIVSTVPEEEPNVAHLKRIARRLVQRYGPMKLNVFYNSMEEAGHQRSIVDSVMRRDPELEFTLDTVEWRDDRYNEEYN